MRVYTPLHMSKIPEHATRVFKGILYDTYHWQQEMFDGSYETFEMLRRPDTVKVIPVHEGKLILTKQSQPHTKEFIDFPGGIHDHPEESELSGAQRELREETGYLCSDWRLLLSYQPNRKIDQCVYLFLATRVTNIVEPTPDVGEKIELLPMEFGEWKALRNDPIVRAYPKEIFDKVDSLDALLELPSIYTYEKD